MHYRLDLGTILQLLEAFQHTGILSAELPPNLLENKEQWLAYLDLTEGKVDSCVILDLNGDVLYAGSAALNALLKVPQLDWTLSNKPSIPGITPLTTDPLPHISGSLQTTPYQFSPARRTTDDLPLPEQPFPKDAHLAQRVPVCASSIPQRTVEVHINLMRKWSRNHRKVYILINGRRNVEQIRRILLLQASDVEQILYDLHSIGVIRIS